MQRLDREHPVKKVNVCFDDESLAQLADLQEQTGKNRSDIIRIAIEYYYTSGEAAWIASAKKEAEDES